MWGVFSCVVTFLLLFIVITSRIVVMQAEIRSLRSWVWHFQKADRMLRRDVHTLQQCHSDPELIRAEEQARCKGGEWWLQYQ